MGRSKARNAMFGPIPTLVGDNPPLPPLAMMVGNNNGSNGDRSVNNAENDPNDQTFENMNRAAM